MPPDLEIDRKTPLNGTAPFYAEQIVIATGRSNWPSRVEDDEALPFVSALKRALTRGGQYANPFHNVLLTASSLPSSNLPAPAPEVLLFPSFTSVTFDRQVNLEECIDGLIRGFTNPPSIPQRMLDALNPNTAVSPSATPRSAEPDPNLLRKTSLQNLITHAPITTPTVLICGHGERDSRCGIVGPILEEEFKDKMSDAGVNGRVALISHIGGHKYAGNVIVYIPLAGHGSGQEHPLAGMGIWYGRVEPRHVEGIVSETLQKGTVIGELLRGGIDGQRQPLKLL